MVSVECSSCGVLVAVVAEEEEEEEEALQQHEYQYSVLHSNARKHHDWLFSNCENVNACFPF